MAKTTVPGAYIADNAVVSAKIASNAIEASHISGGAVVSVDIGDNSITISKIAANAVSTSEIAANAIGSSEIAANAVDSAEIVSGSIDTAHIADSQVTNAKLANSSVTVNSNSLSLGASLTLDTDDIGEGSSNLYHTTARVNSAFDTRLGTKDTGDLSEGSNLYLTTERVQDITGAQLVTNGSHTGISFSYDDANDGAIDATVSLSGFNTDALSEGSSNLYFTNARAQGALTAGTGIGISSGTISIGQSVATNASPTFDSLTLTGALNITGDINSYNVTDLDVVDKTITLGVGQTEANSDGSGIVIDGSNASMLWEEGNDQFRFNKTIAADVNVASSNFLGDANIYALRLTNDDTTAGNTVGLTFGHGGGDFTNFITSVRTGTGSDPKGDLVFGGRPSDGASFLERMRIEAGGDVGIGTDSPDTKLHVFKASAGSITDYTNNALIVENSTDVGISLLTPNGSAGHLMFGSPGHQYHSYIRGEYGDATNPSTLKFFTDQVNTMTHKDGKVGIRTDSPNQTLSVNGNIEMTAAADRRIFMGGQTNATFGLAYDGNNPDYGIFYTEGSPDVVNISPNGNATDGVMSILGSGKVGINDNTPSFALSISDSTSAKISLGGGTNQNGIRFEAAGNDGVSSSLYYLGVGSDLMSSTDYGAILLDVTNNRSVLLDDQSNSRLSLYNNKIFVDNNGIHVRNGSALRLLPTDNHDTDAWILYQYTDSTLRYNFTGAGEDEIAITPPGSTNGRTLTIDTENQRLGIGGTGPLTDLHIEGTNPVIRVSDDGTSGYSTLELRQQNTTTEGSELMYDSSTGHTHLNNVFNGGDLKIATNTGSFGTTSTNVRMTIASDGYVKLENSRSEYGLELNSAGTRSGLVLNKPGTSSVMGSLLMLSNEEYRLGTASYYHINMTQTGKTWFGNSSRYGHFDENGNLNFEHGGVINFEAASNDYSTVYSATGYSSQGYGTGQRYWNHMISKGGTHITVNSDGGHTASENNYDDFVVWQGTQDTAEPLFRVSNTGRVIAKQNYEIGNHKTNREEFGVNAINTIDEATSDINTTVTNTYENRSGVYWLNFNSKKFRAFVRPQWLQGRNWVLAAKFFAFNDMPSGSALWTNDASWNGGDFDLNNGHFSKYGKVWRYFGFTRLAMQMGDRVAPIMQFSSTQTLYGAFSGGRANNGGGVSPTSTDPALSTGATYHGMTNYVGPAFTDLGGQEDKMQSYGLNKWANSSTNSTSANNQGTYNKNASVKGFQLTLEDSHPNVSGNDSVGRAGAWIGCPLDEGNCNPLATSSNSGADSGFGFGGGCGNNARTWTSGIAEWNRGNEVANYLPGYIWLSVD